MTFGSRLKLEREIHGLSQRELADIGGIKTNAQGRYESGMRHPRADYLCRLHAASIDVSFILTGRRSSFDATQGCEDENTVLKAFRSMPSADRAALKQIMISMTLQSPNQYDQREAPERFALAYCESSSEIEYETPSA